MSIDRECSWRAATPVSWISFTTGTEGQGQGTVGYRIAENAEPVARQAMLSVAERQVALSQQAAPCRYTISGVPTVIGQAGGQSDIALGAHAACAWTARSEASWATIAPTSGSGNAVLRLAVLPNTGDERPVTLTIAGERVTAVQSAAPSPAPPTPSPTPPPPPPTPPPSPTPPTPPPPSPTPPTPAPTPVREVQLEDEVRNLSGVCPLLRFTIDGQVVYTTTKTSFERGPCSRMRNGVEVEIRGWLMSDNTVRADRVRYEDDD